MQSQVARFRREAQRADLGKRGCRYPDELRDLAIATWRSASRDGLSQREVAAALGIREATLVRWIAEAPEDPVPVLSEVVLAGGPGGVLTLVTPSGYRVEGLSLADLTELMAGLQ